MRQRYEVRDLDPSTLEAQMLMLKTLAEYLADGLKVCVIAVDLSKDQVTGFTGLTSPRELIQVLAGLRLTIRNIAKIGTMTTEELEQRIAGIELRAQAIYEDLTAHESITTS